MNESKDAGQHMPCVSSNIAADNVILIFMDSCLFYYYCLFY